MTMAILTCRCRPEWINELRRRQARSEVWNREDYFLMATQQNPYRVLNAQSEQGELLHQILVELRILTRIVQQTSLGYADDIDTMYADPELSAQKPTS